MREGRPQGNCDSSLISKQDVCFLHPAAGDGAIHRDAWKRSSCGTIDKSTPEASTQNKAMTEIAWEVRGENQYL
jgi:hypothetical protein